jgi:carbamoyltransferase
LDDSKISYEKIDDVASTVASALHQGAIVGWFQGRMEFGPRALGSRSILADPTDPDMKRKINAEVKHREAFRPFAPSVVQERAQDYFDISVEVPYMLKVASVRVKMRDKIPAVVHVDGTARVQTVDAGIAPEYHKMITEFGKLSGHPVVLNTSFNVIGEPIVESPIDALRCFYSTGLDLLAIGSFIIRK